MPVALAMHADVVARPGPRWRRRRAVRELSAQVLALEHFAEPLGAPVSHQELEPRPAAQPAVTIVAEDPSHPGPYIGYLIRRDEYTEPLGHHRVGRQASADPQVKAGITAGAGHADERHIVDLVRGALRPAARDRGLVFARQVSELGVERCHGLGRAQRRGRVEHLGRVDSGDRAAENVARNVAAGLEGRQADLFQTRPDVRNVLNPDPVELDVLPIGDVREVAAVLLRDPCDGSQLTRRELPARDADPHHEVRVLDVGVIKGSGLAARYSWPTLRVQPPPAKSAAQVGRVDRSEPRKRVPVDYPLPDVEPWIVLLETFGRVQRLVVTHGPLALAALRWR